MENQLFARQCSECNCGMNEGFVSNGGEQYYCSETCLKQNYTGEEIEHLYSDENTRRLDYLYYTAWEDVADYQYIFKNGILTELETL